ncbi:hypothetical protein ACSSS7_001529 [Eimeria intestinalis]
MWIGNIGKKSAAFINHKPFHPGNYQNQEKVWLAEQKLKEDQKKEKELEERRREEVKIEELRRALRGEAHAALQLQNKEGSVLSPAEELRRKAREAAKQQALQRRQQEAQQRLKQPTRSTLYEEDVFARGHTSVFGSLYSKEKQKWGFSCCGSLDRSSACSANPNGDEQRGKKRKTRGGEPAAASTESPTEAPRPPTASPSPTEAAAAASGADGNACSNSSPSVSGERTTCCSLEEEQALAKKLHVVGNKKKAREGGVAAFLKFMGTNADNDDK